MKWDRMKLFLISLAALYGLTQNEQLNCMTTSFIKEDNPVLKVLRPSLKNGTRLSFNFSLKYNWKDNNDSGHYYVDFESYTRQVVLRLQFTQFQYNQSKLTVSSIRRKNKDQPGYDTPETVGSTKVWDFSHGTIPVQIILNTTVTDKGFHFTIEAQKDGDEYYDPVKHFRVHGHNYIPYQTTSIIYLKHLPDLIASMCYPIDECIGVCLSCPQGTTLQPLVDSDEKGKFNNTHKCTECSPGNHSATVNSEECSVCQPGHYTDMFSMSSCEQCSKGTSSDITGRSTECDQCVLGTYSSEPGATQCVTCPAGSTTDKATGAKTCAKCEAGTFSKGETTMCTKCPENSVSPNTGAVECVNCIYGALTATHCTCVAGTYRVSETTCKECKEGRYTPQDNMLECLECAGKVTEDHKCECPGHMKLVDDVCVRNYCTPGQKKNADGTCSTCSPGSYSVEVDSEECLLCDPGSYQDTEGEVQCKPCPRGTSQHLRGSGSCVPCQMSTYQNQIGQRTCIHCRGTVNSVEHSCQEDLFECGGNTIEYTNIGSVTWPRADNNKLVKVNCEHGGIAQRSCVENSWLEPILLDCNSQVTEKLNKVLDNNDNQDVEAIKEVVSEEISKFGPKDIKKVAIAIETISPKNKQVAASKLETAVQITSYDTTLQHVLDLPTKERIVSIVEEGVGYLVENGDNDLEKFNSDDISISVNRQGSPSKQLGQDQMVSITQNSTFSTIVYHNSKLFESQNSKTDLITSEVFSIKLHGEEKEVKEGFNIDLTMKVLLGGTAECRWYDTERSAWSTRGCHVTSYTGDILHCQCNHLTSFAAFTSLSEVPEGHKQTQSVITTLLFVLSIITLVFTLLVYIPIRSFRKRLIVQVELMEVTALILANITFLSLAHARHQSLMCTGLVFGVQYLYLVTIAWSFVAALVFYRQIVTAIHTYGKSYNHTFKISCVLCWVLPLIFPSFALIYSDKHNLNYLADMDGEFGCWISETWKIYTFIVPILVVVAVNTFLGIRVVTIMIRASNNRGDDKDDTWKIKTRHIKSILSLIMLFGVSFLLSLFTYGPQALVFQYLFIIFTCSQGLFIFILFVPLRPEVHAEWKTILGSSAGARLMSPRYSSRTSQATNSSLFNKTNNKIFVRKESVVDRCVPS